METSPLLIIHVANIFPHPVPCFLLVLCLFIWKRCFLYLVLKFFPYLWDHILLYQFSYTNLKTLNVDFSHLNSRNDFCIDCEVGKFFPHMNIHLSQHHLLKCPSYLYCFSVIHEVDYICVGLFLGSLFWSNSLFIIPMLILYCLNYCNL